MGQLAKRIANEVERCEGVSPNVGLRVVASGVESHRTEIKTCCKSRENTC